jgi:hypothetical protein
LDGEIEGGANFGSRKICVQEEEEGATIRGYRHKGANIDGALKDM